MIVAKRTGLLLTFDHGFGDNETSSYDFVVVDSSSGAGGAVVNSGTINTTFDGLRKISAVLMAFPIKNEYINPYLGVGVGLLQTTGNEPDDGISSALGSTVRTASHSCMASEKEPTLKYASAKRREVRSASSAFPSLWYATLRISSD